jgi:hypothetical protein
MSLGPFRAPFALLAFAGFVAVLPPWVWFVAHYTSGLGVTTRLLANLVLPTGASLLLASWLQPR